MDNDEFETWIAQWDKAQEEIAQEKKLSQPVEPTPVRTSFFNNLPSEQDFDDDNGEESTDDWNDIYQRAVEIDYSNNNLLTDDVNIQYAGTEGYGKETVKTNPPPGGNGKKVYTQNPVHFASAGKDQEGPDGHVRVSNNFSDGEDLLELDALRRHLEAMERKFHEADILKKTEKSNLQTELKGIRERVQKLSEKLVSSAKDDLS